MLGFKYIILITCFIVNGVRPLQKNTGDAIGFPEAEENLALLNKENRNPVFLPSMCPENELFYPGDQKDDWICDCRPGFIYYPPTDKCWPAFRKGPCQDGQYLILPVKSVIPNCQNNPCVEDNLVLFNGKCEALGSSSPCQKEFPPATLWLNATTLAVECVVTLETRFSQNEICPPGCKRNIKKISADAHIDYKY